MTRLAVITINHHHTDMVPKAIASMSDIANACSPHMFLINNIPDQAIKDWLSKEHPEITLIENLEPQGFGSNINSVIRQFQISITTAGQPGCDLPARYGRSTAGADGR